MHGRRTNTRSSVSLALVCWLWCATAWAGSRVERPMVEVSAGRAAEVTSPYQFLEGEPCPLEQSLLHDAVDGRLDEHSLLAAALIAGGVQAPDVLARYEDRLAELAGLLRGSGKVTGRPRTQARPSSNSCTSRCYEVATAWSARA